MIKNTGWCIAACLWLSAFIMLVLLSEGFGKLKSLADWALDSITPSMF